MKLSPLLTGIILAAMSAPVRAEFLVIRIGENAVEQAGRWAIALFVLVVILTLRGSRNKGGQGN
jgi:hypothetical protein